MTAQDTSRGRVRSTVIWPVLMLKSCSRQEHLDYSITVHRLTGEEAKALKLMGFLTGSETCSPREGRPLGEKRPQNRCFEQILFASSTSSSYSRATASSVQPPFPFIHGQAEGNRTCNLYENSSMSKRKV